MNNVEYTHRLKENGNKARIVCKNRIVCCPGHRTMIVLVYNPNREDEDVQILAEEEFNAQYKKITPWDNCKIDDPIYVKIGNQWYKRHFAGTNSKQNPLYWARGFTSFTIQPHNDRVAAAECYPADQAPEYVVKCAVA